MWMKKTLRGLLLTSLCFGGALSVSLPVQAAENCEQQTSQKLNFLEGENLFTVLAWLNWVTAHDSDFDPQEHDPIQSQLMELVKTLPPTLRQKHRKAYEAYLSGAEDYTKNGLLILDSQYYGKALQFAFKIPQNLSQAEAYRLRQLPSAELLREFYETLDLGRHWKETFKPVFVREQLKYREAIQQGAQRSHCLLKINPSAPVDVIVNPLDAFGTSGQTSYNAQTQRFLIKLHVDAKQSNPRRVEDVAAHEYTHALMNEALKPYEADFEAKMQAIGEGVGETFAMPLQELFAQSVGYLKMARAYPYTTENIIYYSRNLLFPTFLEQSARWQTQTHPVTQEIAPLIAAIDVSASQALWRQLQQKQEIQTAVQKYADIITPKLVQFKAQIGDPEIETDIETLWLTVFSNREHLAADMAIRENVFYIFKNPLFLHVAANWSALEQAESVDDWVQEVFTSFSVEETVQRWQAVAERSAKEN